MSINLATVGGAQFPALLEGQVATGVVDIHLSRVCSAAAGIAFGKPVAQDGAGGCQIADSTHLQLLGISCMDRTRTRNSSGNVKYTQYAQVDILETGEIGIIATEDYHDGDQVIALFNTTFTGFGSSAGGAANGSTRLAVPNAYYTSSDATQPVVVGSGALAVARLQGTRSIKTTT